MTGETSPHSFTYQSCKDFFPLSSMYQQPYIVPPANEWNHYASNVLNNGYYYSDWYPNENLSASRKRKRPFTIRAILGLNSDEHENNNDYLSSENSWPQRLTPEPFQMSSARCTENEEVPHHVDTVSSSDSCCMSNQPAHLRLSPPCMESQSTDSCRSSEGTPSPSKKSKRIRTIFTPHQLEKLEEEFQRTQYMVGSARIELASELSLTESQVKVWFQNRRIKLRKQFHESQQAKLAKLKENDSLEKHPESDINNCQISSSSFSSDESQVRSV